MEDAVRKLASQIVSAIESDHCAHGGAPVLLPDLCDAVFDPPARKAEEPFPRAHRFLQSIALSGSEGSPGDLVRQLREVENLLIWGHAPGYTPQNVGQAFLDSYCHALLTGPDGPLRCASPLGAFVLFGPDTLYRDHVHAPNEVYLAVTEGGQWRVGNRGWQALEAGRTIFIPSNAVHAIRSGPSPLLTFSFWLEPGDMGSIAI